MKHKFSEKNGKTTFRVPMEHISPRPQRSAPGPGRSFAGVYSTVTVAADEWAVSSGAYWLWSVATPEMNLPATLAVIS